MHPFGGNAICPRCSKAVYAAEQAMGPGRKLYHKPCLACMICSKRLDSRTLLEHNQEPYCKTCHVKNFGTRDLRQANLPHRSSPNSVPSPLPPSPRKKTFSQPSDDISDGNADDTPPSPGRSSSAPSHHDAGTSSTTRLVPGAISRKMREPLPESNDPVSLDLAPDLADALISEERDSASASLPQPPPMPSRRSPVSPSRTNTFPSPPLLSPTRTGNFGERRTHHSSYSMDSPGRLNPNFTGMRPLVSTATGTRYGSALGGANGSGSPLRKWGATGTNPTCPRCQKTVFFAEQVKAIGKTYHKGCLRCSECSTLLDSTRLTEKDGQPFCHRCYSKVHGPQGSGYALLGKAGG